VNAKLVKQNPYPKNKLFFSGSHDFTTNIVFLMYKTEYEYFLCINTSMHNFVHGKSSCGIFEIPFKE
jgi:hypothetical protein